MMAGLEAIGVQELSRPLVVPLLLLFVAIKFKFFEYKGNAPAEVTVTLKK